METREASGKIAFPRTAVLASFGAAALLSASCTPVGPGPRFYQTAPDELPGKPGSLIRSEPINGAPAGARAYRILYRSTDRDGRAISVSGLALVPSSPAPAAGRPIVSWAHPTVGVIPRCAPSRSPFRFMMIPGLARMLKQGFVVVATDYEVRTGNVQAFLDGTSEGHSVLDAARAAAALPAAHTRTDVALWGHSQGGQAVLFAAEQAGRYAPELKIVGVAAAAPATDLAALLKQDLGTDGGNNLAALALWSWSHTYGADYSAIIDPSAQAPIEAIAQTCIDSLFKSPAKKRATQSLRLHFLSVPDIASQMPWKAIIAANSAGLVPSHIPVFLAQGTADEIVYPQITYSYMGKLCDAGSKVHLESLPGVAHGLTAMKSADATINWFSSRLAGDAPPNGCGGAQESFTSAK